MGSKVLLGNLLVIPVEDSLLYIEPLYIRAQNGQLPELQRVLASYDDRTVMGTDLESTLAALFKGQAAPAPTLVKSTASPRGTGTVPAQTRVTNSAGGIQTAADHYDHALDALKAGDWTRFGNEMQLLGAELGRPPGH
jgi:hypothetical protein